MGEANCEELFRNGSPALRSGEKQSQRKTLTVTPDYVPGENSKRWKTLYGSPALRSGEAKCKGKHKGEEQFRKGSRNGSWVHCLELVEGKGTRKAVPGKGMDTSLPIYDFVLFVHINPTPGFPRAREWQFLRFQHFMRDKYFGIYWFRRENFLKKCYILIFCSMIHF